MHQQFIILAALALVGCASTNTSSTPEDMADGAIPDGGHGPPRAAEAGALEAGADGDLVDAPVLEASADTGVTCVGLGQPCTTSATCFCGLGAGCNWDNVTCRGGVCVLDFKCDDAGCDGAAGPLLPPLDAGDSCCASCENRYDVGASTLAEWKTCAASCGAVACPITCLLAENGH